MGVHIGNSAKGTRSQDSSGETERLGVPRRLVRVVRRDPEHVAERLAIYAVNSHGQDSWDWAQRKRRERPNTPTSVLVEELRLRTARLARIDGAISGTPSFIALVPAYVAVLWEQARMVLRIAALEGRDPRDPEMVAEFLALRGVYPTAREAADAVAGIPPEPPKRTERRPLNVWFSSWFELVQRMLVLAGFVGPPVQGAAPPSKLSRARAVAIGAAIWVVTWVVPGALMVLMSWTCESATRKLGTRAVELYGDPDLADRESAQPSRFKLSGDRGSQGRAVVRILLIAVAVVVPLLFLFFAAVQQHQHHRVVWFSILAGLSGIVLVIGLSASMRR
jgi:hypothetical protein